MQMLYMPLIFYVYTYTVLGIWDGTYLFDYGISKFL